MPASKLDVFVDPKTRYYISVDGTEMQLFLACIFLGYLLEGKVRPRPII